MSDTAPARTDTPGSGATSLALTILAIVLAITAYVLVGLGEKGKVPSTVVLYGAMFVEYSLKYCVRRSIPRVVASHDRNFDP